ncbi:olfactory receptor 5V1-like [Nannospalax galili]|uniref:olfactory receptor 5V1-like n=1 Tax=Nannospalax galili TaxID=1026970 RepID=UPI0004ED51A8|nr:olfactory receptor 5V1-like [Nannospalax galili]XP_008825261.1 olfactory receptor 5V1-like [Nannospalax galili]
MSNQTRVTHFILRGFSDVPELRLVVIPFFLLVYSFGLLGNISIVTAVTRESRLHSPMYFFLKNLSFLDMCYTSATIPKALVISFTGSGVISYRQCVAQLYIFFTLACTECFLLTAMAYDRCLAILRPLLYGVIMNQRRCSELVAAAWVSGAIYSAFHTFNTFSLPYCGPNVIEHFFCDIPPVMRLSCTDYHVNEEVGFAVGSCILMSSFALTVLSYVGIVSTVVRIPSVEGRGKAFSTCSSHLTTVVLFYGTGSFVYLRPASQYSPTQGRLASIFYSVLTPSLNPLVYCVRNKDMKFALQKLYCQRKC